MLNIAIIIGSTRPERKGEAVAKWVYEVARKREDARFELVDLENIRAPFTGRASTRLHGASLLERTHQEMVPDDRFL